MKPVTAEVRIEAPLERVFHVCTDLEHAPGRLRGIKALEVLTPGPIGKGTRFRETRVMFGREASETMEIVEFQPGRGYTVTAQSCGARYRTEFAFAPESGGAATRMRVTFEGTPVSLAAKLMAPLTGFMVKACAKVLQADCADIKAACEGRSPQVAPAG
jgi:uncharacterized protein YndB with AHSA1/START domain